MQSTRHSPVLLLTVFRNNPTIFLHFEVAPLGGLVPLLPHRTGSAEQALCFNVSGGIRTK